MEEQEHLKIIADIIDGITCPKNFQCYRMGFRDLCEAKDFGLSEHLECLEKNPEGCKFSVPYGSRCLCQCPLRIYIAKKLKK
jgi:hypothetical protein